MALVGMRGAQPTSAPDRRTRRAPLPRAERTPRHLPERGRRKSGPSRGKSCDLSNAKAFEAELGRAIGGEASAVVLDLAKVEFIDSTGICALLAAVKLSSMTRGRLTILREFSAAVSRTIEITGLEDRLPFH
jgi:anti-sigma B factor antagonist